METVVLPEQRDYQDTSAFGPYTAQTMGKFMTRDRFERILPLMTVFLDPESIKKKDLPAYWTRMNCSVDALTTQFQKSLLPRANLTLDESMIKSYHRHLPGKNQNQEKAYHCGQ